LINTGVEKEGLTVIPHYRIDYHMSYAMHRTSMSLDGFTLKAMEALAKKWGTSKSDVVRQAVRNLKLQADAEDNKPTPLEALDWLQNGGGLSENEAETFRAAVMEERAARKYWWES
jgi:Arc/MetJ-type ribon-helix-helix transcriptional regulator